MSITLLARTCFFFATAIAAGAAFAQTIPPIPTSHPRILLVGAELQRLRDDLTAATPPATRFKNMVDNAVLNGANIYDYKPWYSAMVGVMTGQAVYCTDAVVRIDSFLDEEAARITNRAGAVPIDPNIPPPAAAADSYLEIGDAVGNVALVYDWCPAFLNATQRTRWGNYADRFVTNVWDQGNAQWGIPTAGNGYSWSGIPKPQNNWSINNPVNNYYYSFLRATMLWGLASKHERAAADGFLQQFRNIKIANQLVPTFNSDLVGGGSREGTGYGTAMKGLFGLYVLWEKTTGERIADLTPHTQATMPYMLHAIAPTKDRLAPIGDHARDETAQFYDYHREMLLALSAIYRGTPMARRVRADLAASSRPQMGDSFNLIYDYLYAGDDPGSPAQLHTSYYAPGTGHFFTRSSWNSNATWLTFLTGPYSESHAHQDGFSLLLFKNGWLVNDANMQTRSGIFQTQEAHALVTQRVGGALLRMYERPTASAQLRALAVKPDYTYVSSDAGTLFDHPNTGNPGVRAEREIVYLKPDTVVVFDRSEYTAGISTKTFQLPTPGLPSVNGRTVMYSNGASTLTVHAVSPASSALSITDLRSVDADFQSGYRIDSAVTGSGMTRFLNVLAIDNAVTSTTPGANEGEVTLLLADGRSVLLRFNLSSQGGTIEIRNAAGQVIVSETLPTTTTLPALLADPVHQVTVNKAGSGVGSVSSVPAGILCGLDCTDSYAPGTLVTLTATVNAGSTFDGWSGVSCTGGNSSSTCSFTLSAAVTVTATLTATASSTRLVNLSTRGQVQSGDNVMIGGFIIGGASSKTVLIRAVGPNLANFGVPGVLANPTMQLFSGQTVIGSNDDWQSATNAAAIQASGLAPANALESAILVTLAPGTPTHP